MTPDILATLKIPIRLTALLNNCFAAYPHSEQNVARVSLHADPLRLNISYFSTYLFRHICS